MVLGIHLHRDKVQEAEDIATPTYANTSINQIMQPRSPGERADRREKGIDIDLIELEDVTKQFEWLAGHYEQVLVDAPVMKDNAIVYDSVPALDAHGNPIYTEVPYNTESGITLMQKQAVMVQTPRMAKQLVNRYVERAWAKAVLVLLSKSWPTIWMTVSVANNKTILFRTLFYEIRESMPDEDKEEYGVLVSTAEAIATARLEDCKDGHKGLLIKVDTHKLEVNTNRGLMNNAKTS